MTENMGAYVHTIYNSSTCLYNMQHKHMSVQHTSTVIRGMSQAESVCRSGILATFGVQEGLSPGGLQQSVTIFFLFSFPPVWHLVYRFRLSLIYLHASFWRSEARVLASSTSYSICCTGSVSVDSNNLSQKHLLNNSACTGCAQTFSCHYP